MLTRNFNCHNLSIEIHNKILHQRNKYNTLLEISCRFQLTEEFKTNFLHEIKECLTSVLFLLVLNGQLAHIKLGSFPHS